MGPLYSNLVFLYNLNCPCLLLPTASPARNSQKCGIQCKKDHIYIREQLPSVYNGPGCGGRYCHYSHSDINYDIIRFYLALMTANSASNNPDVC